MVRSPGSGGVLTRRRTQLTVCLTAVIVGMTALAALPASTWPDTEALMTPPTWHMAEPTEWIAVGKVPGAGTLWEPMARQALADIHQLQHSSGAVAAGAASRWDYAWPRDNAFVAVALARTGHQADALRVLRFLASVQPATGSFEARYRLDGSGTPDDRAAQSDGSGWVLWAAAEILPAEHLARDRDLARLVERATDEILASTRNGTRLPPVSPDYWEVPSTRLTLGVVAPMALGLRSAERLYTGTSQADRLTRARQAFDRRVASFVGKKYERHGRSGGLDAAVTFTVAPFAPTTAPAKRAVSAYENVARAPAGGLAPGEAWRADGVSWTPESALVGYVAAAMGDRQRAARWLDWLDTHRTDQGSLPEKVNADGSVAGPAPLAWTAALVLLTLQELQGEV